MVKTKLTLSYTQFKRIILFFICLNVAYTAAKSSPLPQGTEKKGKISFLLGLRGGINFAQPQVLTHYTLFANTSSGDVPASKSYTTLFRNLGSQFGIIAMLQLTDRTYITLQPSITTHNFTYSTSYTWINPKDVSQTTSLAYKHENSLKYTEFPLLLRQDLTGTRMRPYVQVGGFYSLLQGGMQTTVLSENNSIGQVSTQIPEGTRSGSVSDQYIRSHLGLIAGAGVSYKLEFAMIGLDLQYKRGMHNITNTSNRYNNQSLQGDTFDVPDDISLHALMISVNVIFSLGMNKPAKSALKCP